MVLRETGELLGIEGVSAAPGSFEHVILSRALCAFEFLETPGLSGGQARKAALLHAEAHAPFVTPGIAVFGYRDGFGIWWWDAARVERLLANRARALRFTPESMAQAPGEDGRIVRGADGFEAQYWRRGRLVASQWSRGGFSDARWGAFLEKAGHSGAMFSSAPAPVTPGWRRTGAPERVERRTIWTGVEMGGWVSAALGLALALGFEGHAARYRHLVAQERGSASQAQTAAARVRKNEALVRAATANAPLPEHLIAVADLLVALETSGLAPASWESANGKVRATASGEADLESLGARLEANPRLRNVAPIRADGVIVVTADVEVGAAALADATP